MSLVPNIKYKTEYCLYWQEGTFKHIQERFAKKATIASLLTVNKNQGQSKKQTFLTTYVQAQHFFHSYQHSQNHKQIISRNSQEGLSQAKPHNYKTVFCKFYAEDQCKLGDKCTYAHQRREKRKKRASQQFKIQPQSQLHYWPITQIYDPYSQYYYQQLYQNYPIYPIFYPSQQDEMLRGEPQNTNNLGQLLGEKVEDILISDQTNKSFTIINQIASEKISQKFQSPQNQSKMSTNSTKTESPVREPIFDVKKYNEQSEAKQKI